MVRCILAPGQDAKTGIVVVLCMGGILPATPLPDFIPDRVIPAADGDPVTLWVCAILPKEGWVPHSPGHLTHAEHPGSAIKYRDQVYELVRIEETAEGGYAFRYGLRPWDPQYAIRHLVNYNLKSQMEASAAHRDIRRIERLRFLILWLFPLAGFAPDPLQRQWEKKTGLNMAWVSAGSALFGMVLAFALRDALQDSRHAGVVFYLALESFARVFWIAISRRPHGSFLLTLPYLLWQGWKGLRSPVLVQGRGAVPPATSDEVSQGPGGKSLRVCSWYFDTVLAGTTLIEYEGGHYKPRRWHQEGKGLARRWIYDLEKVERQPGVPTREYTCPRTPDRQKAVEDFTHSFDMAQSFALIWGAYPRRDQLRLQLLYQYDGPGSTAITAGLFLIVGGLQLCLTAALYRTAILALMGPAYLMLESLYRLYRAKAQDEPAGSLAGYVLRLVIHPPR
jgi:hypothetical protein